MTEAIVTTQQQPSDVVQSPYSSTASFESGWRMAKSLAASEIVPKAYQGKPENCLIALEIASRCRVSIMAVMQSLHVIQGRPSWSASFLIACANSCGQFTPIRFEQSSTAGKPDWAFRAVAKDKASGDILEGPWVSWKMATDEGWVSKNGSKYRTMPELMLRYRAAAFWVRVYAPQLSLGMQTSDEVIDVHGPEGTRAATALDASGAKALEAVLGLAESAPVEPQGSADSDEYHGTDSEGE